MYQVYMDGIEFWRYSPYAELPEIFESFDDAELFVNMWITGKDRSFFIKDILYKLKIDVEYAMITHMGEPVKMMIKSSFGGSKQP